MVTVSFDQFVQNAGGNTTGVKVVGNEASSQYKQAVVQPAPTPSYSSRIKETVKNSASEIAKAQDQSVSGEVNPLRAGLTIAKNASAAVASPIMELPGVKQVGEAFGKVGQKIVDSPVGQKVTDVMAKAPQGVLEATSDTLETAGNIFAIEGGVQGVKNAPKILEQGKQKALNVVDKTVDSAEGGIQKVKQNLAEKNVDPRLKTSAERSEAPSAKYDKFLEQEKKAKVDVKADSALSQVGEKIGESFEKVAEKRRETGKRMGSELEKIGNEKVNVAESVKKFGEDVSKEGLSYDAESKTFSAKGQSRMTSVDKNILSEFASELEKLGDAEVTVKDLDAFVSRVSKDLDLYKSKNNIIGTTNAERIVKNTLNEFKNNFDQFEGYSSARKEYANLSNFLEEGQSYLGQKTQAGDFAKDASVAKSSVQSLLNSGKKDWLARLEDLTGYSALDDSVLALQAMKDMGNPKGASLLQLIAEGDIPTTKMSIIDKILNKGVEVAKEKVLGTPEEQTRAFLKSIEGNPETAGVLDSVRKGAKEVVEGDKMGLSVQDITKKMSSAEKGTLRDFMDLVSGELRPKDQNFAKQLRRDATDIAEKYGFDKFASGDKALSSQIGKFLNRIGYKH